MESKKINQLATAVNPSTSDLAIIGDPVTGVSKKITWLQVSTLIGTAANLQQVTDNGATTTNPVTIGGLTITGLSTGVLKSDSGVISSVPFGAANGVATLAGDGKVPSSQLPSYVDDVVEVANYAALPVTGETGKIYITLDNNKVYRWGGSVYVEIAANNAIWGSITGTLANQTDLQNALDAKANDSAVVHLAGTETITGTKTFSNPSKNDGGILLKNGASYSLSGYMNLGGMTDGLRFTSGGGVSNFFTLPSSVGYTYTFPALSGTIVAISGGNSTQYIDGTGALQTFPTLLSSDNLVKLVRNQSGATMTAGTIVYISGATGNKPLITKAIATSDATSAQTFGLVQANIANNADGYVVIIGNIGDLDTSALTEGQQLYLSGTTAGAWTTTKPYAPTHLVYVGIVLRSHPNQGIIGVKIQNGYEMDELHNVDAQSPSNNDILSYNTSTSLWEHKQIATTLGFTPISLSSLSATSPLSYNNTTGAFSIQVATASQNGYLSSTDWSTFNNKQAALGGTGFVKITGSTISYDNSTYYLASNPSAFITLASLSAGDGISYSNTTGVISSTITQYTDALARAAISSSATGLTYTSATGVFSLTAGYAIPTTAKQTEWDTAYTNRITSLTTTGSSGAATLVSNTLNVPTYTLSGLGGQPLDADLTAIAGLTGTSGFLKKNAADTWSLDTNTYVTTTTAQTISGAKTFSASPIIDGGFATAIPLRFKQYDSASFNSDGYTDLYVMNAYRFGFAFNQGSSNYKGFTFNVNGITLNTSREYTMPNAAGTLALTSDIPSLTGYVPYTGATANVNLGAYALQAGGIVKTGRTTSDIGGSFVMQIGNGSNVVGDANSTTLYSDSAGRLMLMYKNATQTKIVGFSASIDNTQTYLQLPSSDGTLALVSQIPSLTNYVTLDGVQTISAIKKYTDYQQFDNGIKFKSDGLGMSLVSGYVSVSFNASSTNHYLALASSVTSPVYYTYEFPNAAGTLALVSQIPAVAGVYLPLAGGTLTGALIGTSATFAGTLIANTGTGATFRAVFDATNILEVSNYSAASGYQGLQIIGSPIKFYTGTAGAGGAALALTINTSGATFTGALNAGALSATSGSFNGNVRAVSLYNIYKSDNTTLGGQLSYDGVVNQLYLYNNISNGYFSIYTNAAERFQIASTGVATFKRAPMTSETSYNYQNIVVTTGFGGGYTTAQVQSLLSGMDGNIFATDIGYSYDAGGYSLRFATNDNLTGNPIERLRIGQTGLATFSVQGNGFNQIWNQAEGNAFIGLQIAGVAKGYIEWGTNATRNGAGNEMVITNVAGKIMIADSTNDGVQVSGGNTLIGTTSGVTGGGKLQVNGNVNINGVFQINGVTIGGGGGSGVTGSGTTNYVPKWSSASALGNSIMYDTGSAITINRTNPTLGGFDPTFLVRQKADGDWNGLQIEPSGNDGILNIGYRSSSNSFVLNTSYRVTGNYLPIDIKPEGIATRFFLNGNVSIGSVTDTGARLNVIGSNAYMNLANSNDTRYVNLGLWVAGRAQFEVGNGDLFIKTQTNHFLALGTNTAIRMYITGGGNVLVGTETDGGYKFHVAGTIYATGDVIAYSDARVKTNIRPIKNALEKINNSRGVIYDRTDNDDKDNIGFIAQELEKQFPELVSTDNKGNKGVKYQNAVAILFEAIKEQQKQINELKKQAS